MLASSVLLGTQEKNEEASLLTIQDVSSTSHPAVLDQLPPVVAFGGSIVRKTLLEKQQ